MYRVVQSPQGPLVIQADQESEPAFRYGDIIIGWWAFLFPQDDSDITILPKRTTLIKNSSSSTSNFYYYSQIPERGKRNFTGGG